MHACYLMHVVIIVDATFKNMFRSILDVCVFVTLVLIRVTLGNYYRDSWMFRLYIYKYNCICFFSKKMTTTNCLLKAVYVFNAN